MQLLPEQIFFIFFLRDVHFTAWEEGGECGIEERSGVFWGHCTCSLHG